MSCGRFKKAKDDVTKAFFGSMIILLVSLMFFFVFVAYEATNLRTRELEYMVAQQQAPIVQMLPIQPKKY
ncbi:MAG: hypothetical protein WCT49_04380 [Candidatus Paceibacterota bacterium]